MTKLCMPRKMASLNPVLGGYECEFVDPPPDDLICLICTFVARQPQQLTCCGRVYCNGCLEQLNNSPCPHCRDAHWQRFTDKNSSRRVSALKVKCSYFKDGCEWSGELGSRDQHLAVCDYELVECANACTSLTGETTRILRKNMQYHLTEECANRTVKCKHCGLEGHYHEVTGPHYTECPEAMVQCERDGCGKMMKRSELHKSRHSEVCPYETVPCKYAEYGCKEILLRKDMLHHESDTKLHLELTLGAISSLKAKLENVCAYIQALDTKLDTTFRTMVNMDDELIDIHGAVYELQEDRVPRYYRLKKSDIDSLLKKDRYLSVTTFKMVNLQEHKENKTAFYSPPFYTSRGGYKMCVRVSTNDTHISVYLHMMRGENDDDLPWPFRPAEIKIRLLNQTRDRGHHSHTVSYIKDKNSEANNRVTAGQRSTKGIGNKHFLQLSGLTASYLVKDTLYFRVTVLEAPAPKQWLVCNV